MIYYGFEIVVRAFVQVDKDEYDISRDLNKISDKYYKTPVYKYVVLNSDGDIPHRFREYYDTVDAAVAAINELIESQVFKPGDCVRVVGNAGDLRIFGFEPWETVNAVGVLETPVYRDSTSMVLSDFLGMNYVSVAIQDLSKVELVSSKR